MSPSPTVFSRAWRHLSRAACLGLLCAGAAHGQDAPNVLLIILDDSNDWIGALDGHPQARTPRMDALAAEGTLFTSAHAAAALCNPSRASIMTGITPARSGVKINKDAYWRDFLPDAVTLNQAFRDAGYYTVGLGKIYHGNAKNSDIPNWHEYTLKPDSARPPAADIPINGFDEITRGGAGGGDWGVIDAPASAIEDHIVATWAQEFFTGRSPSDTRPFFLAVGFRSTHSPWYFPRTYFDRIASGNTNSVVLPPMLSGDLNDVGPIARLFAAPETWAPIVSDPAALRWAAHSYLAGIRFMDEQVGRVLDALEAAGHADDTIVVLLSDHGYHLGEKQTWQKQKLWEEDTRVPLMFRIPDSFLPGTVSRVDVPVNLPAIYPTLLELAGIPMPDYAHDDPLYNIDYRSLVPLLSGAGADWNEVAVTFGPTEDVSIRLPDQRFTLYRDGSRELYDRTADREEWYNTANDPAQASLVSLLTSDAERYLAAEHAPIGLPDRCGTPELDHDSQPGIFAWQDCTVGPRQAWRIRVTGGEQGVVKHYVGHVEASAGLNNVALVDAEAGDTVDASGHFDLSTAVGTIDGFNFSVPEGADACLMLDDVPTGVALHIGASRFHFSAPVNLRTLAPCGGQTGTGRIGDRVWSDTDRDGVQDAGETGLGGVAVRLIDCADGAQIASTASDGSGGYGFDGLPAGRYRQQFIAPAGYAFSPPRATTGGLDSDPDPATGLTNCQENAVGQVRPGIDAGLYAAAGNEPVAITAWNQPKGGVTVTGNVLRYSGSPTGWVNNTAASVRLSKFGLGTAYEVWWTLEGNPATSIWTTGLGNQATLTDWRDIEYGLRNSGGFLKVYESGTWLRNGPALAAGDVIAIRVLPGVIEYRHNGHVVHTSTYAERPEFYVNASFLSGPMTLEVSALPLP
ncbi:MAG TPA: sulfatase-like hydrolase/transferase [Woeseiaceae bacterium]|nr:sulfatase-like hydrolase/transferase [Woeseiaceae bacterium]